MQHKLTGALAALSIGVGAAGAASADIRADVHPAPAVILQVLKAFDNPEGAIFSADGDFLFVSNAAEIGDRSETFGWTEGEGYVSKLEVLPSGELRMVEEKLIDGLTGPLGMGVLPVATGLVIALGEFGRTPKISTLSGQTKPGRDHWANAMSVLFAGGGTPGGAVVGATDRKGFAAVERVLSPENFVATVYAKLGIEPGMILYTPQGRPTHLVSDPTPIKELM